MATFRIFFFSLVVATSLHRRLAGHGFSAHGFSNGVADVNAVCLFCNKAIKKPYLETSISMLMVSYKLIMSNSAEKFAS